MPNSLEQANPFAPPLAREPTPIAQRVFKNDDFGESTELPIEFRTSVETVAILLPVGLALAAVTAVLLLYASPWSDQSIDRIVPAVIFAFLTFATAFGCLIALRCKISIDDHTITKTDYGRQRILFSQIDSWHFAESTGTIYVNLHEKAEGLALSNWSMSYDKSSLLGRVLRTKIGPPLE